MDSSATSAATSSQTSATTSPGHLSYNVPSPASSHTPCSCRTGVGIYLMPSAPGSSLLSSKSPHRYLIAKQAPTGLRVTILSAIEISFYRSWKSRKVVRHIQDYLQSRSKILVQSRTPSCLFEASSLPRRRWGLTGREELPKPTILPEAAFWPGGVGQVSLIYTEYTK